MDSIYRGGTLETRHDSDDYSRTIPNFPFIYITTKSLLVDYVTGQPTNYMLDIVYGTEPFDFYFTVGKNSEFADARGADDNMLCEQLDIIIDVDNSSVNPYQGSLSVENLHQT